MRNINVSRNLNYYINVSHCNAQEIIVTVRASITQLTF